MSQRTGVARSYWQNVTLPAQSVAVNHQRVSVPTVVFEAVRVIDDRVGAVGSDEIATLPLVIPSPLIASLGTGVDARAFCGCGLVWLFGS